MLFDRKFKKDISQDNMTNLHVFKDWYSVMYI